MILKPLKQYLEEKGYNVTYCSDNIENQSAAVAAMDTPSNEKDAIHVYHPTDPESNLQWQRLIADITISEQFIVVRLHGAVQGGIGNFVGVAARFRKIDMSTPDALDIVVQIIADASAGSPDTVQTLADSIRNLGLMGSREPLTLHL